MGDCLVYPTVSYSCIFTKAKTSNRYWKILEISKEYDFFCVINILFSMKFLRPVRILARDFTKQSKKFNQASNIPIISATSISAAKKQERDSVWIKPL